MPAITIQIDYSLDTSNFFADPTRRAVLQQAANDIASHLDAPLAALGPSAGNTWSETFFSPLTGGQVTVANPSVPANTIVLYAGGRAIGGSEAGVGGYGGYSASGTQAFLDGLKGRGPVGTLMWGGSIAFDTTTNWFVGSTPAGMQSNQADLYSVAAHELGHLLGIGTAPTWFSLVGGGTFHGAAAAAAYGGAVPVYLDSAHWADGLTSGGARAAMDPILATGSRVGFTPLDFAALKDIGWGVNGVDGVAGSSPVAGPAVALPPTPPVVLTVPLNAPGVTPVVLTGPTDGSAQAFLLGANSTLTAAGGRVYPFPGFTGVVRSAVADFNADGVPDYAFATGAGTTPLVRIIDGKSGTDLVGPTVVLGGFTGGVFVSAGDVDRDGRAELAVSADAGGGPRVQVFRVQGGGLTPLVDFLAFDSAAFRGGSRVAFGDVNRDGAVDLIVGAGVGGGPRVSVFSGASLAGGRLVRLVPDFFALDPALRSGVNLTAGDFDGDGYADIAYSTGNTGGPRVRVVSGATLYANPGADVAALPALADFYALDAGDRHGVRLAARDLDGSGKAVLVVGSGDPADPAVRVVPLSQMNVPTTSLQNPFGSPVTVDGVYVG